MTIDVTREELASRIGENGLVVIDVRTPEEWEVPRIQGATLA